MSGKYINSEQVKLYMSQRNKDISQDTAAAKAGISERTGRRIESQTHQPKCKLPRTYRTRTDPLENIWESDLLPRLETEPKLKPKTLYLHIMRTYPGEYQSTILRTLQRRVKQWKLLEGPSQEVMFTQNHPIGQQGISDFTHFKQATITILGEPLKHMLYHYRLAFSGWRYAKVILGGESFTALSEGLQDAFFQSGGVPNEHRTDSLAAAYKNLTKEEQSDLTRNYKELCEHYHLEPTRNNRGKGHENGSIESPHGHLKNRLYQQMLLQGSFDFESIEAYQTFVNTIVNELNQEKKDKFEQEKRQLHALPTHRFQAFSHVVAPVTTQSTITIRCVLYSVPSRLIGSTLTCHLYDDRIEAYVGYHKTTELPRIYAPNQSIRRTHCIDYRHIIESLVKKPGAFKNCSYRDEILPNDHYRELFAQMKERIGIDLACKMMVTALYLAHSLNKETEIEHYLSKRLEQPQPFTLKQLQDAYVHFPSIEIKPASTLAITAKDYDHLLQGFTQKETNYAH